MKTKTTEGSRKKIRRVAEHETPAWIPGHQVTAALDAAGIAPASAALARIMERLETVGAIKTKTTHEFEFRKYPPQLKLKTTKGAA